MKKKALAIALAFMLVFQLSGYAGFVNQADAALIGSDILTGVELYQKDPSDDKTVIASVYRNFQPYIDEGYQIELGTTLYLDYSWELPEGHDYKSGDTFTFTLPPEFDMHSGIPRESLLNDDGDEIGHFQLTKGAIGSPSEVTMTFNDKIENDVVGGKLQLWVFLSKSSVNNKTTVPITFEVAGRSEVLPVSIKPNTNIAASKNGVATPPTNPQNIKWTIDVNLNLKKVNNAKVADIIPAGLSYNNDLKVYNLVVDTDGKATQGSELTSFSGATYSDQNLNVNFGNISTAYRIEYSTKIDSYSTTDFTNTAEFTGDNIPTVPLSKKVENTRGELLKKKESPSYDAATQRIKWRIQYNFGEEEIANAKIVDLMTDKHRLVPETLKIYPIGDVNNANNSIGAELASGYSVSTAVTSTDFTNAGLNPADYNTADKNGFILTINNTNQTAYYIEYETEPTEQLYDTVTIYNETWSDGKHVDANRRIDQKFYSKSAYGANFADRTVNWEIKVNEIKNNVTNLSFTDEFVSDLQMVPGTLVIKQNGTVTNSVYTITYNPVGETDITKIKGFTIDFPNGDDSYTINYKTKYDFTDGKYNGQNYGNKGTWGATDPVNGSIVKSNTANFDAKSFTANNGYKEGAYNRLDKVITWDLYINYNSKTMSNVTITDPLAGVEKYVGTSLEVYEMDVLSNGNPSIGALVPATEYTFTEPSAANNNTLTVKFNQTIDSPYYITFKTDLEGELLNNLNIVNRATLSADGYGSKVLEKTVNIPHAGEYIAKEGSQNATDPYLLNWTIYINRGQSTVANAQVYDIPSKGQILDKASFVLYDTKLVSNNVVINNEVDPDLYTIDFKEINDSSVDSNETFTLTFKDVISTPYILKYNSAVDAKHGDKVTNKAAFSALGVSEKWQDNPSSVTLALSGGSGTGSGLRGDLKVVKSDVDTGELLSGAKFTLTKISNNEAITPETTETNTDGEIEFKNLRYGTYTLQETQAPTGYQISNATGYQITINQKSELIFDVTNKAIEGSLKVVKQDEATAEKLAGAEFTLKNAAGDVVDTKTTDANGELLFTGLRYGNYTLIETNAPFGYSINGTGDTPITINSEVVQTKTIDNKAKTGSLKIVKTDSDDASPLAGVQFTLTSNTDSTKVYTKTTNASGELVFDQLRYGTYTLKETAAPYGYAIIGNGEYQVTINAENEQLMPIQNQPLYGELKVVKTDEDTGKLLAGAEFTLTNNSDQQLIATETTDANGEIVFSNLRYGSYTLKETKAPNGYDLIGSGAYQVTINSETVVTQDVTNKPLYGSLLIVKTDKADGKPLEGAEFSLTRDSDNALIGSVTTDINGAASFTGLNYGTYTLKETKAPNGYYVSGNGEYPVTISSESAQTVTVENTVVPPATPEPTPTPTPTPTTPVTTPTPAPTTEATPAPTPVAPTATPAPTSTPTKIVTKENTPFKGEIEVPEGSTTKEGTTPTNGKVTVSPDGKWTYTPNPGYIGPDRFSIILVDEFGDEEEIWIEIEVEEIPFGTITVPVDKLPKTGETATWPFQLLGLIMLISGMTMVIARRRRQTKA